MDDYLNVEWEEYLSDNEEIRKWLDRMAVDLADVSANISSLPNLTTLINDELSTLQCYPCTLISDKTEFANNMQNTYFEFTELLTNALVYLKYCEVYIDKINKGESTEMLSFQDFMNKLESGEASDEFMTMYEDIVNSMQKYEGVSFAMQVANYSSTNYKNVGCILSPIGKALKAYGTSIVKADSVLQWSNVTTSAAFAIGVSVAASLITEHGEWTDLDWERLGLNTSFSALTSAGWSVLAGSIGGPAGIAIATVVAIPVKLGLNALTDEITGDKIVDKFREGGHTYEIPKNGSGKNGTYDVILEKYDDLIDNKTVSINGVEMSEHNFYNIVDNPNDPNGLYLQHLDYLDKQFWDNNIGHGRISSYIIYADYREEFCNALKKLASEDLNQDEVLDRFWDILLEDYTTSEDQLTEIYNELRAYYGFNAEDYYRYAHSNNSN